MVPTAVTVAGLDDDDDGLYRELSVETPDGIKIFNASTRIDLKTIFNYSLEVETGISTLHS